MTVSVVTAVTGTWEAPLVAGLERSGTDVRVVRRCVDLAELLSAASAGLARAALLSADLQRLDRDAVERLGMAGVAVVGLVDPGDAAAGHRLRLLGVVHILAADSAPEAVAAAVAAAVADLADRPEVVPATAAGDPGGALPSPPGPLDLPPKSEDDEPTASRIVTVWGPNGAPGRTTVAVTLAAELAAAGQQVLLVDADTQGASVAQSLGLLDESAGLAAASRAANAGALEVRVLARLAPVVLPRLRVLTGLPQPRRWHEIRAPALDEVWRLARRLADWTVIDAGFGLESDEEASFDTTAPRRNAATLSAVRTADLVVAVGSGEPLGLQRLVRGLQDLAEVLPPGTATRVVVSRVRRSAIGGDPGERIGTALARYAGVADVLLVPDDRPACDQAMLSARTLTEHAPSSPARLALAGLAGELLGRQPDRRGQRRGWRPRRERAAGSRGLSRAARARDSVSETGP